MRPSSISLRTSISMFRIRHVFILSEKKINVNNLVQSITNNEENIKLDNNESKDCYDCEDRKECNDNSNINKIINILFI